MMKDWHEAYAKKAELDAAHERKRDAAEEMYEALNECRELLLSGYTTREGKEYLGQDIQDAYVKIESAIAKANGRPA